jgi:hypothetical protein
VNQSTEMLLRDLLEKFLESNPIRETIVITIHADNRIDIDTE